MTLYLYDARYNLKTETTYKKLSELFEIDQSILSSYKHKKRKVRRRYYIVDDKTTTKELKELYIKEKFDNETWKVIEGSDNTFLVSNYGRFKRIYKNSPKGKLLMPYYANRKTNVNKHKQLVKVKFKGVYREQNVARLVAYHFVDIFDPSGSKSIKYKNYTYDDLVVYHKNEVVYDNYHDNLEWLTRKDLAKKTAHKNRRGKTIIAIDAETNEIIDYFNSTRHVANNLPVSKSAVSDSLNLRWKTNVVGGKYIFKYEEEGDDEHEI